MASYAHYSPISNKAGTHCIKNIWLSVMLGQLSFLLSNLSSKLSTEIHPFDNLNLFIFEFAIPS